MVRLRGLAPESDPRSGEKYETSTLKVHRFLDGFSRALDTENDPKNREKV